MSRTGVDAACEEQIRALCVLIPNSTASLHAHKPLSQDGPESWRGGGGGWPLEKAKISRRLDYKLFISDMLTFHMKRTYKMELYLNI